MLAFVFTAGFVAITLLAAATLADSYYRAFKSYGRIRRSNAALRNTRCVTVHFENASGRSEPATVTCIGSAMAVRQALPVVSRPQLRVAA